MWGWKVGFNTLVYICAIRQGTKSYGLQNEHQGR